MTNEELALELVNITVASKGERRFLNGLLIYIGELEEKIEDLTKRLELMREDTRAT